VYVVFHLYAFTTFDLPAALCAFCRAEAGAKLARIRTAAMSSLYMLFLRNVSMRTGLGMVGDMACQVACQAVVGAAGFEPLHLWENKLNLYAAALATHVPGCPAYCDA
jgi:hypothetical protein